MMLASTIAALAALGYEIEERGQGQESGDGGSINGVYPQVMASKQ